MSDYPETRVRCSCGVYFWSEVQDDRQSLDGWTMRESWPKHSECEECRDNRPHKGAEQEFWEHVTEEKRRERAGE